MQTYSPIFFLMFLFFIFLNCTCFICLVSHAPIFQPKQQTQPKKIQQPVQMLMEHKKILEDKKNKPNKWIGIVGVDSTMPCCFSLFHAREPHVICPYISFFILAFSLLEYLWVLLSRLKVAHFLFLLVNVST